jgi:L-ascorbate metabolism protein UlaG (beta-lactamase superfamily)
MLPSLATVAAWASSGRYEPAAANTFLSAADYYLVAHAHAHGFDVVTHEKVSTSTKRIKIPDACIVHGVKTMNTFAVLRRQKALFTLDT